MKRLLNSEINFMKVKDTNMEEKVYKWEDYVPGMKIENRRALIKLKKKDGSADYFWRAAYWIPEEQKWTDGGYYEDVYEEEMIAKIMFVD